jgi:hypothetical protein
MYVYIYMYNFRLDIGDVGINLQTSPNMMNEMDSTGGDDVEFETTCPEGYVTSMSLYINVHVHTYLYTCNDDNI